MSVHSTILNDLTSAMKARQVDRLAVLRMLKSALLNAAIASGKEELSDDEVIKVLQSEAKKRRESAAAFAQGGRSDLAKQEQAELAIIQEYLPAAASEAQIRAVVEGVIGQGVTGFGAVMGKAMQELKGTADGEAVKQIVTELTTP